jgi:hypothetical protein
MPCAACDAAAELAPLLRCSLGTQLLLPWRRARRPLPPPPPLLHCPCLCCLQELQHDIANFGQEREKRIKAAKEKVAAAKKAAEAAKKALKAKQTALQVG